MLFDEIEIRWRAYGEVYTLILEPDGRPHLVHEDDWGPLRAAQPEPRPVRKLGPPRRGKQWTEDEDLTVVAHVNSEADASRVAEMLGRSKGAVLARAVKLGTIDPGAVTLRFPGPPKPA
jgi:hypothetical protein